MELKDIVCDLELAKKLKELGIEQDSLFYLNENCIIAKKDYVEKYYNNEFYSAFTSDEILKKLPKYVATKPVKVERSVVPKKYCCWWRDVEFLDNKLSNSLVKMWIWLVENKYIEVTE